MVPGDGRLRPDDMTRADLRHLHRDDLRLWMATETATWRLACEVGADLRSVHPMRKKQVNFAAGYYFFRPVSEIHISLREKWHPRRGWGSLRPVYYILDTIAHEVAHCLLGREGGLDHGPAWQRTHGEMLLFVDELQLRLDFASASLKLREL